MTERNWLLKVDVLLLLHRDLRPAYIFRAYQRRLKSVGISLQCTLLLTSFPKLTGVTDKMNVYSFV